MSDTISGLNSSYLNGTYTNSTTSALESTLNNKDLSTSSCEMKLRPSLAHLPAMNSWKSARILKNILQNRW